MNLQKIISLAALTATFVLLAPADGQAETTEATTGEPEPAYVYFITPAHGTYYPDAPTTLDAQIGVYQGDFDIVEQVELLVDGVSVGFMECSAGCTFVGIELEQGMHELRVDADLSPAEDTVIVYVGEEPPSDTGESGGESGGESDTAGESEGDTGDVADEIGEDTGDSGASDMIDRGCSVDGSRSPWALLALPMLLLIPAVRRRRRD